MNYLQSLAPIVASLLLCAGGCGGSGYAGGTLPDRPAVPHLPPGNVTVTITARDMFGAPVSGGKIGLIMHSAIWELDVVTDADGKAQVTGGLEGVDEVIVSAAELYGIQRSESAPVNDRLDFDVTLHPASTLSSSISRVSVANISADGRQLEFGARLHVIETAFPTWNFDGWNIGTISVLPSADPDVPYEGATLTTNWVDAAPESEPLAVSLLLDQGASVAVTDTADRRLLAAKYLQMQLEADDRVVLAAFAADDSHTGQSALLPTQPVTLYPTVDPAFTTDGRSYFPTIDALASFEGGASPLHAAIKEMIDFTTNHAPADSRRVVVALASGISDCGSPAECAAAEAALRQQSASTGVAIVVVGLSDSSSPADWKQLGTFAQADQGAVFWAQNATQVPTIFGRIPEILDERHGAIDVTIRLQSPVAGAFSSGNTVMGILHVVVCPWDCTEAVDIPFALRVP